MEQTVFQQINEYRAKKGLSTLTWDAQLATKARTHSKGMADKVVPIGHDGFENRVKRGEKAIYTGVGKPLKKPLEVRVKNASKRISHRAAENVAYNMGYPNPAAKAVQGWLTSNGHRQNIEGQYTVTGVGVSRNPRGEYYFTQIFIQK
ncbi:CAP domain-containing protein [Myxacorys almedinensis A]|uniref:CAP domain-containing protein n=1 Tax=Myxacorys almedinensis A TaxID=2690445 RepID=A0A8J8CLQ4_9CYAN|nr:CAP domain-containing protein [Myxacorys almedinensis A]